MLTAKVKSCNKSFLTFVTTLLIVTLTVASLPLLRKQPTARGAKFFHHIKYYLRIYLEIFRKAGDTHKLCISAVYQLAVGAYFVGK